MSDNAKPPPATDDKQESRTRTVLRSMLSALDRNDHESFFACYQLLGNIIRETIDDVSKIAGIATDDKQEWKQEGDIIQIFHPTKHTRSIRVGSDYAAEQLVHAHNAELAAERTNSAISVRELEKQLLSAQAAIAEHNNFGLCRAEINVDLSALDKYVAEKTRPLVEALTISATGDKSLLMCGDTYRWMANLVREHSDGTDYFHAIASQLEQIGRALDALAKSSQ